ncbi:MAG: ATP-binding protein [Bifidobacteriaceae bacterium]|jgi:predicted transcriptional regulator|nr:ATP-binding protein [Bifidobacteriaceae bacterium]
MVANPFKPTFGSPPPVLAGRDQMLASVMEGLDSGPGNPNRTTIFVGPRGSGKTVLLSALASEASSRGWVAVEVTARAGLAEAIVEQTERKAAGLLDSPLRSRLSAVGGFGFSLGLAREPARPKSWRAQVTDQLEQLAERGSGLLITIDEVDPDVAELVDLVADYQHLVREGRQVALAMAGLPGHVLRTLTDRSISFVRRAYQRRLDNVSEAEAAYALRHTIEQAGGSVERDALDTLARFTGGFPFLIQLAGYHAWREARPAGAITLPAARRAQAAATADMDQMILETTLAELSPGDVAFLRAMAADEGPSRIGEVAARLGKSAANAGQYRRRLISAGVIEARARGEVAFELPLLRGYLLRHPA